MELKMMKRTFSDGLSTGVQDIIRNGGYYFFLKKLL